MVGQVRLNRCVLKETNCSRCTKGATLFRMDRRGNFVWDGSKGQLCLGWIEGATRKNPQGQSEEAQLVCLQRDKLLKMHKTNNFLGWIQWTTRKCCQGWLGKDQHLCLRTNFISIKIIKKIVIVSQVG